MMRAIVLLLCALPGAADAAFLSTSSDPADRAKELEPKRCATTYKRMQAFVKYWGPREDLFANYIMYHPDKVGFRGYDLLGDLYYQGCAKAALAPDKVAAYTWYQNAALAHLPEAQWKLGRMLYEGDGIPADSAVGLSWLNSAALEGSREAAQYLRRLDQPVPNVVTPATYERMAAAAKRGLDEARAAQWAAVRQDLGTMLRTGAQLVAGVATAAAWGTHAATPTRVTRPRPVYCQYQGTAHSYYPQSVSVQLTAFCQ